MSLSRLFGRRPQSSVEWVVCEHSAFFSCLSGFRREFVVPDVRADFHLWPDYCDCANDFFAVVNGDAITQSEQRSRVFAPFYIREMHNFSMQMPRQISRNANQSSISRRRLGSRDPLIDSSPNCRSDRHERPSAQWNSKLLTKGGEGRMKLSVETQVGVAVAAAFLAMTAIAIAQGDSKGQTGGTDAYGARNNPTINIEITEQRYNGALQPTLWVDPIRL